MLIRSVIFSCEPVELLSRAIEPGTFCGGGYFANSCYASTITKNGKLDRDLGKF
ncbi:MAG: hypothetical protein HC916_07595 [Coleofasciculaceae cyanobacterium SM2_1_6]|nr:hypothetical protein [Coleofasciculaceae cyanobacterium SM2_1_6]